ncbi:MAG: ABC transporter permease [Rudaea sp.]
MNDLLISPRPSISEGAVHEPGEWAGESGTAQFLMPPMTVVQPTSGWASLQLRDLWEYRELLYFLVWRDVKIRYKQTALGIAWVVLQPVLTTLIFTVVFGNLAKIPSDNLPYAVFALAGLVPWNYFSGALSRGGVSLVNSSHLISKVYFPRLVIPLASVLAGLLDMVIVLALLFALMLFYGVTPTLSIVLLPFLTLLAITTALGVSLWLSALNVQYRDINYLIPFFVQFWMYATPVVYPASLIPERWRPFYALNPMAGVVEGFRWALFGAGDPPLAAIGMAAVTSLLLVLSGAFFFRRMEKTFADIV